MSYITEEELVKEYEDQVNESGAILNFEKFEEHFLEINNLQIKEN